MNASSINATSTLESRLRQIAILVASVDTTAARQLLMHLPTEVAKRVRAMAADIGPVPPEERRALLAEFQKSQAQLKSVAADQEMSRTAGESTAAPSPIQSPVYSIEPNVTAANEPSWTRLGVETLVRLVKIERPTVISVVLQQLPAAQAAAVLQRLPRSMTREVLQTLGSMQDIDEEARKAIDEHLSERLRDYHHKMESELEQNRRMTELLAAAPEELRQQWAAWLRPDTYLDQDSSPQVAKSVSATANALNTLDRLYQSATITTSDVRVHQGSEPSNQSSGGAVNTAKEPNSAGSSTWNASVAAVHAVFDTVDENVSRSNIAQTRNASPSFEHNSNPATSVKSAPARDGHSQERRYTIPFPGVHKDHDETPSLSDSQRKIVQAKMQEMLSLSPEQLAKLLSNLDSQTTLYSLAGASPSFMKRFRNMLEPEDAQVLDQRLKHIGTVSLREIDQAQGRLVNAYDLLVNSLASSGELSGKRSERRAA